MASGLASLTTYYWRVNALESGTASAWSGVWSFTTAGGCTPPAITSQPKYTSVVIGVDSASFSVSATGTGLQYQWQRSNDGGNSWASITGAQSATYTYFPVYSDTTGLVLFQCVITGSCGNVMSSAAAVVACHQPTITVQPSGNQLNVAMNQALRFSIAAVGVPNITYQWEKSLNEAAWTPDTSANGRSTLPAGDTSFYHDTVRDAKAYFRCLVSNSTCGSGVASDTVLVTSCAAPYIPANALPVSQYAIAGQTAAFSISAMGNNLTYQWQHDSTGTWVNFAAATDTFFNFTTTSQMAGSNIPCRCVVTAVCSGSSINDTSSVDTLKVVQKTHAYFFLSDSVGPAPLTDTVIDSSMGVFLSNSSWVWYLGTGSPLQVSANSIEYPTFSAPGTYQIKLVVSGTSGTDSMIRTVTVYPSTGNPILVKGKYKTPDSVILTYSNLGSLSSHSPAVGSITLWNRSGAIPVAADVTSGAAIVRKTYTLAALSAQPTDTVAALVLGSDTTSGYNTQITWSDGTQTPLLLQNGCQVTMHATAQPPIDLTLGATYSQLDTVTFTLGNVQSIDTAIADSVLLWFGLGADSTPNFTATQHIQRWSVGHVDSAGHTAFSYILKDSIFNTYAINLYAAVVLKGKNTVLSNPVICQTQVGRVPPNNPLVLNAHALNSISIQVTDSGLTANDSIDEIRVYYRKGTAISTGINQFYGLDSLVYIPPVNVDTAYIHIQPNTRYYFGAQVRKQGLWSNVTPASSATDSTPSPCTNCVNIQNVAQFIKGSGSFDTISNLLIYQWAIDTAGTGANLNLQNLQLGVSCMLYGTADSAKAAPGMQADSTRFKLIPVQGMKGGSDTIPLNNKPVLFDTTFHVYLWLKQTTDATWAPPTVASSGTVKTLHFFRQNVNYSFEAVAGGDTTLWVNRMIRFYVPVSSQASQYTAIIQRYPLDSAKSAGFIAVSQPFFFSSWQASAPFYVGMQYHFPDSLAKIASRYSLADAKIYRFDTIYGRWQVQTGTVYDNTDFYASIDTGDLTAPFALMIDTTPPAVQIVHGTFTTSNGSFIYDTVHVTDNVGNLSWQFMCRTGASTFFYGDTNSQKGSTYTGSFTAPVQITRSDLLNSSSSCSGIQALFLVNDGRNTTVQDLSPTVTITPYATIQTQILKWRPAFISGVLDSFRAANLFKFIDSTTRPYQTDKIRLFRFAGNSWAEYANNDSASFEFKAGRLFWVKTLDTVTWQFGRGTSLPLSDSITIPLYSKGWTDFALPFNFNMKIGDILAASSDSTQANAIDSLQFYAWDTAGSGYICQPIYIEGVSPFNDPTAVMGYPSYGFTVYNPTSRAITLRIPPVSAAISTVAAGTGKKAVPTGWNLKVAAKTAGGTSINPVYCGFVPSTTLSGASFYPMPPSLEDVSAGVCEDQTGVVRGHKMVHALNEGGCSYLLTFKNNGGDAQTIGYHIQTIGTLPAQLKIAIFNPVTDAVTTPGGNDISVPLDGRSSSYRMLLVGSEAYLAAETKRLSSPLAFERVYPNPVRGAAHLCYTMPLAQIGSVGFRIFDLTGRMVWSKLIAEQSMDPGSRECLWNGTGANGRRVAPGVYIVQLSGFGYKGNRINSFERTLMVAP